MIIFGIVSRSLSSVMNHVLRTTLMASLYAGCCGHPVNEGCIGSWCPPPIFPDLLAAFSGSLVRSPAMRNLTAQLLSPGSAASAPCRRLVDCCLPPTDYAAPRRPPCTLDQLPALPSCQPGSRDPVASGRNGPVQFSRSLENSGYSADWFDTALSKSDGHPSDGQWQVADLPRSANDRSSSATDRPGSQSAAAASDVNTSQLWSSVRGRLLIIAVTISMLASVVVLAAWICLRKRLSKYEAAPETEQEAICMYERVLADRSRSRDRRHHRAAAGSGSDVISDERTLFGPGDCGPTPTRRYV